MSYVPNNQTILILPITPTGCPKIKLLKFQLLMSFHDSYKLLPTKPGLSGLSCLGLISHGVLTFWHHSHPEKSKKINSHHPRKPDSNLSPLSWTRPQKWLFSDNFFFSNWVSVMPKINLTCSTDLLAPLTPRKVQKNQ